MFMFPAGSARYQIKNSLRFRASASAYLNRTPSSATNRTAWTWSGWIKKGTLGGTVTLFTGDSGTGTDHTTIRVSNSAVSAADSIDFASVTSSSVVGRLVTSPVYRDPAAWYHIVAVFDTGNATPADRMRLYVNDSRVTSFGTNTNPALNAVGNVNATVQHRLGGVVYTTEYFDGYLAEVNFIDGQALTPASFGQTDPVTGSWIPKKYTGTYGTNGFYLPFNDGSNLTNLCLDRSGNGNNWTATNVSLTAGTTYDWMVDTPTNNYCVLNPLDRYSNNPTDGNLKIAGPSSSVATFAKTTIAPPAVGLFYAETTVESNTNPIGVRLGFTSDTAWNISSGNAPTNILNFGFEYNQSNLLLWNGGGSSATAFAGALNVGDIVQLAIDFTNGKFWLGKNNVWYNSGSPSAGTTPSGTFTAGSIVAMYASVVFVTPATACTASYNFGQRPFSYTPPTGFKALCTANLPDTSTKNPANVFVTKLDTKANIMTTLAAARSGWTDYVDIIKNRAAVESWGWRFSHLAGNEYALSSSGAVYQANRAMSGTDAHVGYSIRIGAAYGTAAGAVSHTTGANTTVTHGVGVSARQMILLFPRAGGSIVRLYHPGLSAGNLLNLCATDDQSAGTAITNVTSTSFQLGSALATGTYDYLVLSEMPGVLKLGNFTGNGANDGTMINSMLRPGFWFAKILGAPGNFIVMDSTRDPSNIAGQLLYANDGAAESSSNAVLDMLSNGVKYRQGPTGNNNGFNYIYAEFAASAFKYANAR